MFHTYSHTKNTMLAVEMINRNIMLWHDGREKSNLAYLNKHDFMFEKNSIQVQRIFCIFQCDYSKILDKLYLLFYYQITKYYSNIFRYTHKGIII